MNSVCKWCGKPVPSLMTADGLRPTRSLFMTRHDPNRYFCRMRCAAFYALDTAAADDRYRAIKRKS